MGKAIFWVQDELASAFDSPVGMQQVWIVELSYLVTYIKHSARENLDLGSKF